MLRTSLTCCRGARAFSSASVRRAGDTLTRVESGTYTAPLAKTVRNIKMFSLGSLVVSAAISPIFFLIDSEIDTPVRVAMVGIALATSACSTGVIAWVLKPYVVSGRLLSTSRASITRLDLLGRRFTSEIDTTTLRVDRNGRMFSNLRGGQSAGSGAFYIHENTPFWRQLGPKEQVQGPIL